MLALARAVAPRSAGTRDEIKPPAGGDSEVRDFTIGGSGGEGGGLTPPAAPLVAVPGSHRPLVPGSHRLNVRRDPDDGQRVREARTESREIFFVSSLRNFDAFLGFRGLILRLLDHRYSARKMRTTARVEKAA